MHGTGNRPSQHVTESQTNEPPLTYAGDIAPALLPLMEGIEWDVTRLTQIEQFLERFLEEDRRRGRRDPGTDRPTVGSQVRPN